MKKLTAALLTAYLILTMCPMTHATGYTVVTEPQYNMAEPFTLKVTKVSKNTKWALADASGAAITAYKWDAMGDVTSEYIPAKSGGLWGVISSSGNVLIPYNYLFVGNFNNGIALAQTKEGKYVYINIYGKTLFESPFTYSFSPSGGAICGMIEDAYGYCDTEGTIIIRPQFEMAFDFHEGYAGVQFGGKWGFITSYGQYSVKPTYDFVSDYRNGHAICRLNGKYGLINTSGAKTAPFTFDYIGTPDDSGLYPAKSGSTSGYINANGVWQIKTDYDYCYRFTDSVARVYKDGLWGFIDAKGNELIAPTFFDLGEYRNGRAPFSLDGSLWGYLSLTSTVATPKSMVTPTPPASTDTGSKTETPAPSQEPQTPAIVNPAGDGTSPLPAKGARCISMKIGSGIAYKGSTEVALATAPALINGTTMIPVRDIVELLGGTIAWNAQNQRINISCNFISVSMTIDSKICYIGGTPSYLTAAPVLSNGSTLVPLRSVSTALKCEVEWVDSAQNIYIYY